MSQEWHAYQSYLLREQQREREWEHEQEARWDAARVRQQEAARFALQKEADNEYTVG